MLSIILARICSFTLKDVLNKLYYVLSELHYALSLRIDRHSEFWGQNSYKVGRVVTSWIFKLLNKLINT